MRWIKEYRDRLIIQTGHIYTLSDGDYKVLTATADMTQTFAYNAGMTELVFHMQNTKDHGMRYVTRRRLEREIRQHNRVTHLFD